VGNAGVNFGDERLPERFWTKVSPCPMTGCWLWTGAHDGHGYGHYRTDGGRRGSRTAKAYRIAYETLVGPVRQQLDHRRCVRFCVNPAHLEDVDQRTNLMRGDSPSARHARQTHCSRGHEFTPANTYRWRNARQCRTCIPIRQRRSAARASA
jgi:hypothetical protein